MLNLANSATFWFAWLMKSSSQAIIISMHIISITELGQYTTSNSPIKVVVAMQTFLVYRCLGKKRGVHVCPQIQQWFTHHSKSLVPLPWQQLKQ